MPKYDVFYIDGSPGSARHIQHEGVEADSRFHAYEQVKDDNAHIIVTDVILKRCSMPIDTFVNNFSKTDK